MLKTVLLVLAGLVAGLSIAFWLQPSSEPSVEAEAASGSATVARSDVNAGLAEERLEALEDAFAAEVDQRVALEAHVAELSAQIEALGEKPIRAPRSRENASNQLDPGLERSIDRMQREAAATPQERQ